MNFSCGIREDQHCSYWVEPDDIMVFSKFNEITIDLTQRLGRASWGREGKWSVSDCRFWFHSEQDRTLFILKWL